MDKQILKAMVIAVIIAFLAIAVLGWQYRQLEKKQLPAIEEKIEKSYAQGVLGKFMEARIEKREAEAKLYLTEGAIEQVSREEFFLINRWESYEILSHEQSDENEHRFVIRIYQEGGRENLVEVATLIKILDNYYIDSVEIAG